MVILFLIISVFAIVLYLIKLNYEYWESRGVPGPKPKFIVGNFGNNFLGRKTFFEVIANIYHKYKQHRIVGIYKASTPCVLICDPELVKEITIKSFSHFHDNDFEVDKKIDPLFGRNPFFLCGEEWKTIRSLLSPAYSSGKMRLVYPLLEHGSEELVNFIEREALNSDGYEAKKLCSKYTLNNVASCAFGLDGKCFENVDSEFKQIAEDFFKVGTFQSVLLVLGTVFPCLMKIFPIKIIPKDVDDRITNIVAQTLQYRKENNVIRNDFLHILQQLKETCKDFEFTDFDVAAHASGFILDGYETVSIVMSFLLYELAANRDAQEKLRKEVVYKFNENGNQLAYETLHELPYLDAVINETLRMYPPLGILGKKCTKPYTLIPNNTDSFTKSIVIEKGTPVYIPLFGIQRDSNYFENPDQFTPENFVGSNKEKIKNYTFMPFGEGPRACLGQRFGLLQLKTGVAHVIKKFELTVNTKTKEPIQFNPLNFLMEAKGKLWINFKKISN